MGIAAGAGVALMTGISERRGAFQCVGVVLEDASEDVGADEFSFFPGGGAEAGGPKPPKPSAKASRNEPFSRRLPRHVGYR